MILSHILLPSLVHGIDLMGLVLLTGGLVFRTLVLFPTNGRTSRLEGFLPFFLILTGLSDLILGAQMLSGRPIVEVWAYVPTVLLKSHFGKVWIAHIVLLSVLWIIFTIPKSERFALAISALLLLTTSLSSHAADSGDFSFSVLAAWLHLLAASAWIGGLFVLASLLRNWTVSEKLESITQPDITSLERFFGLAGVSMILILVTGGYQTWQQVGSLGALFQTAYGQTLLLKLLLTLPFLALSALMRYQYLPRLSRLASLQSVTLVEEAKKLFNRVTLEIGLGLAIIACSALLMQEPSAKGEWTSPYKVSGHSATHSSH